MPLLIVRQFQAGRPAFGPVVKGSRSASMSPRSSIFPTVRQTTDLEHEQAAAVAA